MTHIPQAPTPLPAAGWYADPENPAAQRYWDGTAWTDSAPPPVAAPRPPVAPQPAPYAPYAPYGPPPVRKKSRKGLVIAGVVALVVVIGIIAAAASGGSKGSPSSGGTSASSAKIGTPVRDGKFEFTVTKFQCGVPSVGSSFAAETAQGAFCVATVNVRNIGDEPQMFDADAQDAYNANADKYDASSAGSLAANSGTQSFLNNINPGNQVTGVKVVWDVPKTTTLTKLELHDSPFSGGVDVQV